VDHFSSWRYRDAAAITRGGLEATVAAALATAGLAAAPPSATTTLDGVLTVGIPLLRGNARIAVEVLPPEAAARNPPHAPLGAAGVRHAMLKYRGWGVAQVAFSEWQEVREEGEEAAAAYLKSGVEGAESDLMCTVR